MKKKWTIFNGLLVAAAALMLLVGCSDDHDTGSVASGKVVQNPVVGATVFLDIDDDRELDANEPNALTDSDGKYSLNIPDDTNGMLCSIGGTVAGSGRAALPMLAPRNAKNITALTTLVGINPGLKSVFGENWDQDPFVKDANGDYVFADDADLDIVEVKYLIEILQSALASSQNTVAQQFQAMTLLAGSFEEGSKEDMGLDEITEDYLNTLQASVGTDTLPDSKKNAIFALADSYLDSVDDIEEGGLANISPEVFESKIFSEYAVNFSPDASDATKSIIPLPNDLALTDHDNNAATPSLFLLDTSDIVLADLDLTNEADIAKLKKKVLYQSINDLALTGLSPNTPMSIPLTTDGVISDSDLAAAVKIFKLPNMTPETDFKVAQEDEFIKIYPIEPLDPASQYVVVLKSGINVTKNSKTAALGTNPVFEMLKTSYEDALPEAFQALTPLKTAYAQIFTGLANLGQLSAGALESIPEDEILMLFTFQTAAKTLAITDFAKIVNTIQTGGANIGNMGITGVSYSDTNTNTYADILEEYLAINGGLALAVPAVVQGADTFNSIDITTLGVTNTPISVPYTLYNKDKFAGATSKVVVFQHGFGGSKADAQAFAAKFPDFAVAAIDLPYHGDRVSDTVDFLSDNLPQNRINFYQSFFDMSVFIQAIKGGKFNLDTTAGADTPDEVYFAGISLGSITGSVAAKYSAASLDKAVLNVGGANFAALFDTAKNALLAGILEDMGVEKNTTEYFITLGVVQLIMDPCDPVYQAGGLVTGLGKTVFPLAYNDTVVSNISNEILANAAGSNDPVYIRDFSSPDAFVNGTPYIFGGLADKTDNWMPHGFLLRPDLTIGDTELYPEAADYLDESYVSDGHDAAVDLTTQYLNN
eukprot:gnl/Chilomastix_cuspidata/7654.p1 GENE.gnl/Chilomastix_cuspidata/7654~~gnl/Chilomastix_cuspidata/7654.p1  ORF type:complete len:879 (+),score=5.11 gnl/Chilomastix_cuspidata/7654:47-2683(+)